MMGMPLDLRFVIGEISRQAEDFLVGATSREQGRAGIAELIAVDYSQLDHTERKTVVEGVMAILEHDDFFGTEFVGNPFADEPDPPDHE